MEKNGNWFCTFEWKIEQIFLEKVREVFSHDTKENLYNFYQI